MKIKSFVIIIWVVIAANIALAQHNLYHYSDQDAYDKALQLYEKGQFNACIKQFDDVDAESTYYNESKLYSALAHLKLFHTGSPQRVQELVPDLSGADLTIASYELGNYYFSKDNFPEAINYYEKVNIILLDDPSLTELNFKLGYAYFTQKNFEKAQPLFYKSKIHHSKYQTASTYFLSFIYMHLENWEKAIERLEDIEADASYGKVVPTMLIKSYYKLEDYKQTISYFSEKNESTVWYSSWSEASMYAGAASFELNNYADALKYYQVYMRSKTKISRDNQFRIGVSHFKLNEYNDAIEHLKFAAFPDDSLGQLTSYYLGISHTKAKNMSYASEAFKHAAKLEHNPKIREEALFNWGKTSFQSDNKSNAIIALKTLSKDFPNSINIAESNEILSQAYFESNNYYDALVYLESVKVKTNKIKKSYQFAAQALAVKYYNCGNFADAELYLDKAFNYQLDKSILASSYFLKAELLSQSKRFNEAILAYSGVFQAGVLKSHKYYLPARFGVAYAYYNHKEYGKALGHFKHVIANQSNAKIIAESRVRSGDCYYVQKKYDLASAEYSKATGFNPDYAMYHNGLSNYLNSKPVKSKSLFNTLIQKYPKSGYIDNATYQIGLIESENSNYDASVKTFSTLLDNYAYSDLTPKALAKRALSYANLNKYEEAKEDYVKVIKEYSTTESAKNSIYGLQEVLGKMNKSEEFDDYLSIYKSSNPDAKGTENIEFENAKNLLFSEKYMASIKAFERFATDYPKSSFLGDSKYYLAESYRYYGMISKAIVAYEEVITMSQGFFINKAIYKCANLFYSEADYDKAIVKYDMLLKQSLKNKDLVNGNIGIIRSNFKLDNYAQVIEHSTKFQSNQSLGGEKKNEVVLLRAKSLSKLSKDSLATIDYIYVSENSSYELGAEAKYLIAKSMYKSSSYNESIEVLRELKKDFGSYDYWVAKSFILIADNYIELDEVFQAKATLNSVIEHTSYNDLKKECEIKLQFLEQSLEPIVDSTITIDTSIISEPKIEDDELD